VSVTITSPANGTLTVDDSNNAAAKSSGKLTATAITGLSPAGISYSGIGTLTIKLGKAANNFTIGGTVVGTTTSVLAGPANDHVTIQATGGPTTVNLGSGTNFVSVGSAAPSVVNGIQGALTLIGAGSDFLSIHDSGSTAGKTGTLTATSLTGLGMGASGIAYNGFSLLFISLGSGADSFSITATPASTITSIKMGGGNDSLSVTGLGGPTTVDGNAGANTANVNFAGNFTSTLTLLNFVSTTLTVGTSTTPANFSGTLSTTGNLTATIYGDDSGKLTAGSVTSISLPNAHATGTTGQVLEITQAGVIRQILAVPATSGQSLSGVSFKIFYDGSTASTPQAAVRVTNSGTTRFDLVLTSSTTSARFDLSRVDAGASSTALSYIRNVAVDGNLLGAVTAAETSYFTYPAGTVGGVVLTKDNLIGVSVRDDMKSGSVNTASIEGVSFATLGGVLGTGLTGKGAAGALANGTKINLASDTFRVPFGETNKVTLFVNSANDAHLNDLPVVLTDQLADSAGITAFILFSTNIKINQYAAHLQQTDFVGAGASLDAYENILGKIPSTGPLAGSLLAQGLPVASITAASVIGNIDLFGGSITGTFQTTAGDLGAAITNAAGTVTGVTYIHANLPAGSRIISRGNLISTITTGTLGGTIAAQGNIGLGILGSGGKLTRFGGIIASSVSAGADIVALGNIYGDISVSGTFAGRLAAKGLAVPGLPHTEVGIHGKVTIGTLDRNGAVISGGLLGDNSHSTSMNITTSFAGFLASIGAIKFNAASKLNAARTVQNLTASSVNAGQINNIWTNGGTPLKFDITGQDLAGLTLILTDLNNLALSSTGVLSGTVA
jgi:hypothetical protein